MVARLPNCFCLFHCSHHLLPFSPLLSLTSMVWGMTLFLFHCAPYQLLKTSELRLYIPQLSTWLNPAYSSFLEIHAMCLVKGLGPRNHTSNLLRSISFPSQIRTARKCPWPALILKHPWKKPGLRKLIEGGGGGGAGDTPKVGQLQGDVI